MRYQNATALFPRNLARLVNAATYDATPVPSPEYVRAQRNRDARAFWASAAAATRPAAQGALSGSRYQGGYSAPARCAR